MEIFPCSNYYLRKIKASSCREDSLEVKRSRFNCFVPGFFYLDNKSKQKSVWGTERSGLNMNSEELHGKPLFIGVSEG